MNDSLIFLLKSYLQKENLNLNFEELKLQLLSHPSYPSLHAVTGVLDHFNIKNLALEVPQNKETIGQLPKYFLAIVENDKNKEFVIATQNKGNVEVLYDNKTRRKFDFHTFLNIWDGVIVVIEKEGLEISQKKNGKNFINSLAFLSVVILLGLFFFTKPSLFQSVHFVLSLVGVGVSLLIVKHELGFLSKTIAKFCTASESTSCDAVLNSKGASISKDFKLSDINFIYFVGLALSWIISVLFLADNSILIILSLTALPVTLYSIYYQYNVVKKWCPLCLGIVSVLWLQCCALFLQDAFYTSLKFDIISSLILLLSLLVTATLWIFIKPLLKKQQELEKLKIEHYKFKRNFDLFKAVFSKNKFMDTPILDSKEIVLGNKNAPLSILIVTNPACFYCKEAHRDLEKILNKNQDTVSVTIRFNVPQVSDNIANQVAKRLLEIYNTETIKICTKALHEAYKRNVDLNKWLLKWAKSTDDSLNNLLEKQQKWCHENKINFTPALYVNDRQFPKEYDRSDINYFIDDLIELAGTEIEQPKSVELLN